MDEIEALLAQLEAAGNEVWIAGSQSNSAIVSLEQALREALPPSYRHFVARFGGVAVNDSTISGVLDGDALGEGMGWLYADTLRFREEYGLPEQLLVVQPDEDGPYCLDTSRRGPDGECPLVCYELHSGHIRPLASTFAAWLIQWLREQCP